MKLKKPFNGNMI